jgi:hypothetical protein
VGRDSADAKLACNLARLVECQALPIDAGLTPASCGEQMNAGNRLKLILACTVYWQACEISRVLSECDPVANGIDLGPIE